MFAKVLPNPGMVSGGHDGGKLLTYKIPEKMLSAAQPYRRVNVDVAGETVRALILELQEQPDESLLSEIKPIKKVLDSQPVFTEQQWLLAKRLAEFYIQPLAEVVFSFFPGAVSPKAPEQETKPEEIPPQENSKEETTKQEPGFNFNLLDEQKTIVESVLQGLLEPSHSEVSTHLVHGITGSGKTFVYISIIRRLLQDGQSSLLMLPEIALSYQFLSQLRPLFQDRLAILHSGLSPSERLFEYQKILNNEAVVVIGTRSAVFAPINNLRLIILDEEHDSSYKEQKGMRYHARQVAAFKLRMASEENKTSAALVLGSATPLAESYYLARSKKYFLHTMTRRATSMQLPQVHVVKNNFADNQLVSPFLRDKMKHHLAQGNQIMLLLNRRGHSSYAFCEHCEKILSCPHCSVSLTYHKKSIFDGSRQPQEKNKRKKSIESFEHLKCHLCGYLVAFDRRSVCETPQCKIKLIGEGTQKLEDYLEHQFGDISFARLDQDTTSEKNYTADVIKAMREGNIKILIGTQMIAKGFDISGVTLVGIINTDIGLSLPDFRAGERVFQILVQASGRAGRHQAGEVVFQTMQPEHFVIQFAKQADYNSFIYQELLLRKQLRYPPFARLARLVLKSQDLLKLQLFAHKLKTIMEQNFNSGDLFGNQYLGPQEILGPVEASLYKLKDEYRWHFLFKDESIVRLQEFCSRLNTILQKRNPAKEGVYYYFDIDPLDLG